MTEDEKTVFRRMADCEISSYTAMYAPDRIVVSTGNIAELCGWTKYRVRKALKELVEKGLIERASCGNPAVESCGECCELIYESAPPTNGYAITKKGFESGEWKEMYNAWCRSMEEWSLN